MYDGLKKKIAGLNIAVLVNNVGINTEIPEYFHETPLSVQEDFINVNIRACLDVTRCVVPAMKTKKSGLIINLSSFTGVNPTPLMALYSATKSFMNTWSIAIRGEYAADGIEVISLIPMFVQSNMSGFKKTSLSVPSASAFASQSLNMIGNPLLPLAVSPWHMHAINNFFMGLLPETLKLSLIKSNMVSTAKKMNERKNKQ